MGWVSPGVGGFFLAVRSSSSFHWILIGLGWGSWGCGVFVCLSWHRVLPVDWNLLSFVAVRLIRPVVWGGDCGFCQKAAEVGNAWQWSRQVPTIVRSDQVARAGWSFPSTDWPNRYLLGVPA